MRILILIFFFEIKQSIITRGHNFTLMKKQSFHFPRGPSMYGINYKQSVYMLVLSVNVFKNKIDKNRMSRLSISLLLPCLLPSEVFLGWQSC